MSNVIKLVEFLTALCIFGFVTGQTPVGPYECVNLKDIYPCETNTPKDKMQFFLTSTRREFERCVSGHWFSEIDIDDDTILRVEVSQLNSGEYKVLYKADVNKPITQARERFPTFHKTLREAFDWPDDHYIKGNFTLECYPACAKLDGIHALPYGEYHVTLIFKTKENPYVGCFKMGIVIDPAAKNAFPGKEKLGRK